MAKCEINEFSSRACQLGTKSCIIEHDAIDLCLRDIDSKISEIINSSKTEMFQGRTSMGISINRPIIGLEMAKAIISKYVKE